MYGQPNYIPYQGYSNGFYPPPVPDQLAQLRSQPVIQQPAQAPSGPVDDRIWVQGETAAQSYLVAANGFVRLWDSTAQVFYEKQADATGKPFPLVIYEYKRRGEEPPAPAMDYAGQIEALERRIAALEKKGEPENV